MRKVDGKMKIAPTSKL